MQYLATGCYVYIDGSLTLREYTDREGNRREVLEVRTRDLRMLNKVGERGETPARVPNPAVNVTHPPHNVSL